MIEQPTKIGNKTLYNVRVLNMSVAKHYGLVKEYCEIVSKAREDLKTKKLHELAEDTSHLIPVENSEDTITLLNKYVDELPVDLNKNRLKNEIRTLYTEAQDLDI